MAKKKIPEFKTEQEEAEFWDTHDSIEYLDDTDVVGSIFADSGRGVRREMNSIMEDYYEIFELYQALRGQLMGVLADGDLLFRPFPEMLTLGQLCYEIGQTQESYIDSFKTFEQNWDHESDPLVQPESVTQLQAWFERLDGELKTAVSNLTDEQINEGIIKRGFDVRPKTQLDIYKEALLIFYGKASIYLRALGKPLPESWPEWIG